MERAFYKQIKLAKSLEFKFNTLKNKRTSNLQPISLISYLSKKSSSKTVKLHFYYSTHIYDDSITRYFPLSKREFPSKIECCVYIMHREFQNFFRIILSLLANLQLMNAFYS